LRTSNDAAVSIVPPLIPQGGFSPLRLEGWRVRRDLPGTSFSLSLLPACTDRRPVYLRPSCFSVDLPKVRSVDAMYGTAMRWNAPPTPGVLAPARVYYPDHQHLIDPIRPTRGHIATSPHRLICDASAVRERLGHPRAVPVFRCQLLSDMPSPETPGSSNMDKFQCSHVDIGLRRNLIGSALPNPRNPFHAGGAFRGFHGSHLLRPARLLALLYGSDRSPSRRGLLHPGFQRDRPVAGYDYSSGWTPLLAELSPAGTTARLAAPDFGTPCCLRPTEAGSALGSTLFEATFTFTVVTAR
jgi:hypothetical protein